MPACSFFVQKKVLGFFHATELVYEPDILWSAFRRHVASWQLISQRTHRWQAADVVLEGQLC